MTNLTDYRAEQIADEAARRLEQPELKPCPFCGGEATLHPFFSGCYMAVCKECSVTMPMRDTYEEAIAAWNTRAERTCQRVNNPDQFFADNIEYSVDAYRCSVCNFRLDRITNYCPNCGAKVVD